MDKKTVALTILCFLVLIFFMGVGSTLSAFSVSRKMVNVSAIKIVAEEGIQILDEEGKAVVELEVKSSSVGVRPATGEEDSETSIPTTVNDAVGTEGAYACFKVTSSSPWKILLSSCTVSVGERDNLENVRIGIMDETGEPHSGKDIGVVLASGEAVDSKSVVVVVWLDKDTTKSIAGADISLQLEVVKA